MFWGFGHEAGGILAPLTGMENTPSVLEDEVLTTGPPGKSPGVCGHEWEYREETICSEVQTILYGLFLTSFFFTIVNIFHKYSIHVWFFSILFIFFNWSIIGGFLGGSGGKESTCNAGDSGSIDPWVRKIPWRRKWQPSRVFLPGESHGQRSLAGCSLQGHKEWLTHTIALQCCISLHYTTVRTSYVSSYIPSLLSPPPTPLSHHRAPSWAPWTLQQFPTS